MDKSVFKVHGMDCAEEVAALRAELTPLPGVDDLAFDVLQGKLIVTHVRELASGVQLMQAVARAGLRAEPWRDGVAAAALPANAWRNKRAVSTALSGLLLVAGFLINAGVRGWTQAFTASNDSASPLAVRWMYLAATLAGTWFIVPKAWRAMVRLRPDMNLLMVVAVCGAILLGEHQEAAMVSFLFALSLALEAWSVGRARGAIAALMSTVPAQVRVVAHDGGETLLDVNQVAVGSEIVVRPGEKIPLDGGIAKGATSIDQAPITGESAAVSKGVGDSVFAGTINLDGAIHIVTTKPADDTTLARIIRLVGDAQSKRSPSEQWVERFARYYTPVVMAGAAIVATIPPLLLDGGWSEWFYRGLVLLVIACPCALVISTPVSIVSALTSAARRGVLIKGGSHLEAAAGIKAIAFDKTGTLTEGRPTLGEVVPLSGHTRAELLEIAASIEQRAIHLLGQAIVNAANAEGIRVIPADDYRILPGKGATATLAGRAVWIGSPRLLAERGQETPELRGALAKHQDNGASLVVVGEDRHVCGFISLADRVRPNASDAIRRLRAAGVEHIVMLTGDHSAAAQIIGRQVAVDEVRAELLPEGKVNAVAQLVAQYGAVAMVGDGVNDAPALARANLGIAMGAAGTDAALETADIALMGDDLTALPWLVAHSRRTIQIIRQNIFAALGVKAVFILLNLFGEASLWSAIAADTGMSLVVVLNGLRLLRTQRTEQL